jgi:hypothetical protein
VPKINFTIVIIVATVASGLMIASAVLASQLSGGSWLDYSFTAAQTENFLYSYTSHDVALHRWVTTHIALAMPIVLAAFAICMVHYALDPRKYGFLVALAVWGSVADYGENLVIISLLDGGEAFRLKAILTLFKLVLVVPPQTVALYLFLKQARTRLLTA